MPADEEYPAFPETCRSLLAKHLTPALFEQLKDRVTRSGVTLADVIRSGVENTDSSIGLYAGDAESYTLFAPLFDAVIADYHSMESGWTQERAFLEEPRFPELSELACSKVVSTRMRVGRNLEGFPLGPAISATERREVEERVANALATLEGDLAGEYRALSAMDGETKRRLTEAHLLFKEGDRFLRSAGLTRDWPEGRGLYLSRDRVFSVWVNEEDQLRIIALEKGGDVPSVFRRLRSGAMALERELSFLFTPHLGYVTSCPTNLGTAMRASVHIQLPQLARQEDEMKAKAAEHGLQVRGLHGEHTKSESAIFDLSIQRRLGITEAEAVVGLVEGINALAELDAR